MTITERDTRRRSALLAAARALVGAPDERPVGVRDLCRRAGVTERYLYQHFGSRDGLVLAVFADVAAEAQDRIVAAVRSDGPAAARAAAAVRGFVEEILAEPERGRVLLVAPTREASLAPVAGATATAFVAIVQDALGAALDAPEARLRALGVVGALTALFTAWLRGELDVDRETLTEHCVDLVLRAAGA